MIKNFKTVSMMLLLGSMGTGLSTAATEIGVAESNQIH